MEKLDKREETRTKEEMLEQLGAFSIQKFLKTASEEFELKEGNWFRSTTFLMGLDYILAKDRKVIGGVDLQVYNMNDNIIFLEDVFQKIFEPPKGSSFKLGELSGMKDKGVKEFKLSDIMDIKSLKMDIPGRCAKKPDEPSKDPPIDPQKEPFVHHIEKLPNTVKDPHKLSFSESDCSVTSNFEFEKVSDYVEYLKKHEISRPLLLCLNTMLGLNQIDPLHREFIESLFDLPSFVGMLGGKEYKAFYFFGYDDDFFYFLDPHYVKAAHGKEFNDEDYIKDYFLKNIFKMQYKRIAPSLSICFLIKSSKGRREEKKFI